MERLEKIFNDYYTSTSHLQELVITALLEMKEEGKKSLFIPVGYDVVLSRETVNKLIEVWEYTYLNQGNDDVFWYIEKLMEGWKGIRNMYNDETLEWFNGCYYNDIDHEIKIYIE